jgi:hypothetical protein
VRAVGRGPWAVGRGRGARCAVGAEGGGGGGGGRWADGRRSEVVRDTWCTEPAAPGAGR